LTNSQASIDLPPTFLDQPVQFAAVCVFLVACEHQSFEAGYFVLRFYFSTPNDCFLRVDPLEEGQILCAGLLQSSLALMQHQISPEMAEGLSCWPAEGAAGFSKMPADGLGGSGVVVSVCDGLEEAEVGLLTVH
jgi:hypothetical protein